MADENLEGLEGLDDFGDDFGDQLDSFMEGDEDEGDSELDSFFEDLSTIDDLEMKEDGGSEPEATPEEAPAEESEPEAADAEAEPEAAEETEEALLSPKNLPVLRHYLQLQGVFLLDAEPAQKPGIKTPRATPSLAESRFRITTT